MASATNARSGMVDVQLEVMAYRASVRHVDIGDALLRPLFNIRFPDAFSLFGYFPNLCSVFWTHGRLTLGRAAPNGRQRFTLHRLIEPDLVYCPSHEDLLPRKQLSPAAASSATSGARPAVTKSVWHQPIGSLCRDSRISIYTYNIRLDARYNRPMIRSAAEAAHAEDICLTMVRGFDIPAERVGLVMPLVKEAALMRHVRGKFSAQIEALVEAMGKVRPQPCRELCITQYLLGQYDWVGLFAALGAACPRLETIRLCATATMPVAEAPSLRMSELLAVDWAAYPRLSHFDFDVAYDRPSGTMSKDVDCPGVHLSKNPGPSDLPPSRHQFAAASKERTQMTTANRRVNPGLSLISSSITIFLDPTFSRCRPEAQRATLRQVASDLLRLCGRECRFSITVYATGPVGPAVKPAGLKFALAPKHRGLGPREGLKAMVMEEIRAMQEPTWVWMKKDDKMLKSDKEGEEVSGMDRDV